MIHLDTAFPTIVFDEYLIDPSIMDNIIVKEKKKQKRTGQQFYYKNEYNPYLSLTDVLRPVMTILTRIFLVASIHIHIFLIGIPIAILPFFHL